MRKSAEEFAGVRKEVGEGFSGSQERHSKGITVSLEAIGWNRIR